MDCRRHWIETEAIVRKMPGHNDIRITPQWLVEMEPICNDGASMRIVEVVHGANDWEASFEAFLTRNIPDNWIVTQVEKGL